MSLADELLADLEMDDGEDLMELDNIPPVPVNEKKTEIKEEIFKAPLPKLTLDDVCKLRKSSKLSSILEEIEKYSEHSRTSEDLQVTNNCFLFKGLNSYLSFVS